MSWLYRLSIDWVGRGLVATLALSVYPMQKGGRIHAVPVGVRSVALQLAFAPSHYMVEWLFVAPHYHLEPSWKISITFLRSSPCS